MLWSVVGGDNESRAEATLLRNPGCGEEDGGDIVLVVVVVSVDERGMDDA